MTLDDIKNGGNNKLDNMKQRHEKKMKQLAEEKGKLENLLKEHKDANKKEELTLKEKRHDQQYRAYDTKL